LCISIVHIGIYFLWFSEGRIESIAFDGENALCWPMFPNCENWNYLSYSALKHFGPIYLVLAISSGVLFLFSQTVVFGLVGLSGLFLAVFYCYALSFRLAGNHFLVFFLLNFVYLLLPRKIQAIQLLIASIYLMAAGLKFNGNWLSGSAIPVEWIGNESVLRWIVNAGLLQAGSVYVLILELLGTFFLFSERRAVRFFVIAQFILFHLVSIGAVGWFMPLMMCLFLVIFLPGRAKLGNSNLSRLTLVFLIGIWGLQLFPLVFNRESFLAGLGRLMRLDMYGSQVSCDNKLIAEFQDHSVAIRLDPGMQFKSKRIRSRCEPYLLFAAGKNECKRLIEKKDFLRLRWSLNIKDNSFQPPKNTYHQVVSELDLCSENLKFNAGFPGSWLEVFQSPRPTFLEFSFGTKAQEEKLHDSEFPLPDQSQWRFELSEPSADAVRLLAYDGKKSLRWYYQDSNLWPASEGSPLVSEGRLFWSSFSEISSFDAKKGSIFWLSKIEKGRIESIAISQHEGQAALQVGIFDEQLSQKRFVYLDPQSGKAR